MTPTLDRKKLVEWLKDKARDEEETAEHVREVPLDGESHLERAKAFRDVVVCIERGDPDEFIKPDLSKRPSGEHRLSDLAALLPRKD